MKNINFGLLLAIILILPFNTLQAQTDAKAAVEKVLSRLSPGAWQARYRFINYRVDGTSQEYTLDIAGKDSKTVHVEFFAPPRDSGRQILNRDGEIWSWLPDSKKVVRLADRDSLANGDFNNADVLKLDWLDNYKPSLAKESDKQIVVDLRAADGKKPAYFLIRLWINKADGQPLQQFFYDDAGHQLKSLKYRDVKNFNGIERPSELVMENVITGARTRLTVLSFSKTVKIDEGRFRQENLGK